MGFIEVTGSTSYFLTMSDIEYAIVPITVDTKGVIPTNQCNSLGYLKEV